MSVSSVRVLAVSHPGCVRPRNEDRIGIGERQVSTSGSSSDMFESVLPLSNEPLPLLLCDGMGGQDGGDLASGLAIEELSVRLRKAHDAAEIVAAIREVNVKIVRRGSDSGQVRMGTTVAGLSVSLQRSFWFNVGDSRVYRYRNRFLRQLSTDDVGRDRGLTQSLGGTTDVVEVEPHLGEEPNTAGWSYLLCSDGITNVLEFGEIEESMSLEPKRAVAVMFERAISVGAPDNISLLLVSMVASDVPDAKQKTRV